MNFKNKYLNFIIAGAVLILIYRMINNFSSVLNVIGDILGILSPIIWGGVIAFFLIRPVTKLSQKLKKINIPFIDKHSKGISIIVVYLLIIWIFSIAVRYIVPMIYKNIADLISHMPEYYKIITEFINTNEYLLSFDIISELTAKLTSLLSLENLNKYIGILSTVANSFISFFMSIVISIYLILEKDDIFKFLSTVRKKLFDGEKSANFFKYVNEVSDMSYRYFCGLALDAVIMGSVSTIVYACFDLPYAVLMGVIIAIGNMVPFFGPIIATFISYLLAAMVFGPVGALWVIAFQLILGQIDSNLIQPKILSNSTGISPLLVLISILVCGDIFGPIGIILGVPIFATIKMIVTDYLDNGRLDISINEENSKQ